MDKNSFAQIFTATFISSGLLLSMIWALVARALRINRTAVEAWLEDLCLNLEKGNSVPLIEKAQPVMAGVLGAVYGFKARRRFRASLVVAGLTTITGLILVWHHKSQTPDLRATKQLLEQEADPILYEYYHNPEKRLELDRSREKKIQWVMMDPMKSTLRPVPSDAYLGGIYSELREREKRFETNLAANISVHKERGPLAMLLIIEGHYLVPHARWNSFPALFAFNVFLDFLSVTIVAAGLTVLGRKSTYAGALLVFTATTSGVVLLAVLSVLSYTSFFRGNPEVFWQLLVIFPLTFVGILFGAATIFRKLFPELGEKFLIPNIHWGYGLLIGGASWVGLHELSSHWSQVSLRIQGWRELISFPYALAGATLLPATLVLLVFLLLLIIKIVIKPIRLLQWAQMDAAKNVMGTTYVGGYIMIISAILGIITAWLFPSSQ